MVYRQLLVLHKTDGGYYGTDIAEIACENNVSVTSMQVNFCRWRANDKRFACLNYLGRRRPNYSLREFIPALDELAENILALPILYLGVVQTFVSPGAIGLFLNKNPLIHI